MAAAIKSRPNKKELASLGLYIDAKSYDGTRDGFAYRFGGAGIGYSCDFGGSVANGTVVTLARAPPEPRTDILRWACTDGDNQGLRSASQQGVTNAFLRMPASHAVVREVRDVKDCVEFVTINPNAATSMLRLFEDHPPPKCYRFSSFQDAKVFADDIDNERHKFPKLGWDAHI
jgi:hypothetical protein